MHVHAVVVGKVAEPVMSGSGRKCAVHVQKLCNHIQCTLLDIHSRLDCRPGRVTLQVVTRPPRTLAKAASVSLQQSVLCDFGWYVAVVISQHQPLPTELGKPTRHPSYIIRTLKSHIAVTMQHFALHVF